MAVLRNRRNYLLSWVLTFFSIFLTALWITGFEREVVLMHSMSQSPVTHTFFISKWLVSLQIITVAVFCNLSLQLNWGTERQKCLGFGMKVSKNGFQNFEMKRFGVHRSFGCIVQVTCLWFLWEEVKPVILLWHLS
jgi:hypothetical protein